MENIGVCKFVLQDWTAVKFVSIFASSMFICGLVQSLLKSVFVQALMDFWWVLLENLFWLLLLTNLCAWCEIKPGHRKHLISITCKGNNHIFWNSLPCFLKSFTTTQQSVWQWSLRVKLIRCNTQDNLSEECMRGLLTGDHKKNRWVWVRRKLCGWQKCSGKSRESKVHLDWLPDWPRPFWGCSFP